ncbi:MAG: hypothetical protein HYV33_03950 [Candidatus Kerfeldbacteria bacterium]|nr:hypothetical protein [Candidatus Kerfeldbacteria bacterium]
MPLAKKMKHPVPNQHLIHIGDVVVSFALLELAIQSLIGSLIFEHQRVGQIITAELSFKNLRALAISLYLDRHGEDSDYSKLKPLMNEAGKIEETRNNIIHSIWAAGKDKDHITRIKTTAKEKKGLAFCFEELSVSDLESFAGKIQQCAGSVQSFNFELIKTKKAINNPILKLW